MKNNLHTINQIISDEFKAVARGNGGKETGIEWGFKINWICHLLICRKQ